MNRGVSDTCTPIHSERPRTPKNDHEYNYGPTKNEPDSATTELRLRPRPRSTTIVPNFSKGLKLA